MKAILIFAFASLAVVEVFGGSLYGEKENVIEEVTSKFNEVQNYLTVVLSHIENEGKKTEAKGMEDSLNEGSKRKEITNAEIKKEIIAATRTAIAKGKPLTAIDCIANVAKEGEKIIPETFELHKKTVEEILPNKAKKLQFLKFETDLIKEGLDGLKKEFDEKIKEAKSGFQALKADGLKKASTAKAQLVDIEKRIDKPSLFDEYMATKSKVENKYKEIKQSLTKKLQACVF